MASLMRAALLSLLALGSNALRYEPAFEGYNLNENKTATDPLDYYGEWSGHTYHPSPTNWRFPFYSLFLDKFVNGDPSNDNINGTMFEQDVMQTQLRHGGDIQGVIDSLDYIAGMGVKGLYIAGTPFINFPWGADSYSPLDFTLLDQHYGDIAKYREMVDEIHKRGSKFEPLFLLLRVAEADYPPHSVHYCRYDDVYNGRFERIQGTFERVDTF